MAGGMGGFWGFGESSPYPYPKPEQLRTHATFWTEKGRFLLDMQRANALTDGYALKTPDNKHYVFYQEDASSIRLNLSGMAGLQPAVAVDTKKPYTEISLGILDATSQQWAAPYISDWAIAVGSVAASDPSPDVPTVSPTWGLVTTEAGGTATFTVVLDTEPTADVTIGLSSSDRTEGTVAPASLTFTPANWNLAQTVTVTGADDAVVDGDVPYSIVTAGAAHRLRTRCRRKSHCLRRARKLQFGIALPRACAPASM